MKAWQLAVERSLLAAASLLAVCLLSGVARGSGQECSAICHEVLAGQCLLHEPLRVGGPCLARLAPNWPSPDLA